MGLWGNVAAANQNLESVLRYELPLGLYRHICLFSHVLIVAHGQLMPTCIGSCTTVFEAQGCYAKRSFFVWRLGVSLGQGKHPKTTNFACVQV